MTKKELALVEAKQQQKKVSIEDLLAKARKGVEVKTKEVYVKSLDGTLSINQVNEKDIFRGLSTIDENEKDMEVMMEVTEQLIYNSCSLLRNKELQEAFECVEPFDIVKKVLTISERTKMFEEILILNGFDAEDMSTIIKN